MPLRNLAWQEFKRTPLAVAIGFLNLLVAAGSLLIAWTQFGSHAPTAPSASPTAAVFGAARSPNLLVFISASLGSAFAAGLMARLASRAGFFVALPLSLILAALSILASLLAALWVGIDPLRGRSGAALGNLIFYGHLVVFFACNGESAVRALVVPQIQERPEKDDPYDGLSTVVFVVIALAIWAALVGKAQDWLTQVLL